MAGQGYPLVRLRLNIMTDNVAIALIGAITTTAVGIFNGYVLLKAHGQSKANGEQLSTVIEQTNGIQAKLIDAAHSAGMAAQRAEDNKPKQ